MPWNMKYVNKLKGQQNTAKSLWEISIFPTESTEKWKIMMTELRGAKPKTQMEYTMKMNKSKNK